VNFKSYAPEQTLFIIIFSFHQLISRALYRFWKMPGVQGDT